MITIKQKTFVYVVNKRNQPLMPTTRCGHVRKLLKEGKAVVINSNPFTIKLKYETPNGVQDVFVGIDTGRENIGVGVSEINGDCVYLAEIKTNNKTIKKNMKNRKAHRQARRRHKRIKKQRKAIKSKTTIQNGKDNVCRTTIKCKSKDVQYPGMTDGCVTHKIIQGAEAQFNNRKKEDGWLTPSARQLIQMHMIAMQKLSEVLPISHISLERVAFDFQKLENENIHAWEYGKGPLYGFTSYKDYINDKQNDVCLICGKKHIEYYHHIVPRKDGGTDNVKNIAGLCWDCHYGNNGVHKCKETAELLVSKKAGLKQQYQIGLLNSVIPALIEELTQYCQTNNILFTITDGKETSKTRESLGLPKAHSIDAYCISLTNRSIDKCSTLPTIIFHQQRFKKKSKNIIKKLNRREYYYNGKLVALNRNKADEQLEDSLKEYMDHYALTHDEKECAKHFHELEIKPAKRTYTFHKNGIISPIHAGDIVKYEKHYKIRKAEKLIFVATSVKVSANKVCFKTTNKSLNYCQRINSGCIPVVDTVKISGRNP